MAKGEFWFLVQKICGTAFIAAPIILFMIVSLFHMDWTMGGGPYGDSRTSFYLGFYLLLPALGVLGIMIGFNIGRTASEFLPYLFEWIFGGISVVFLFIIAIITAGRASNCNANPSTYCDEEQGLLVWTTITSWASLVLLALLIVSSALLFANRRSYDTKYKAMTGTANKAIPTANKAVQMFNAK